MAAPHTQTHPPTHPHTHTHTDPPNHTPTQTQTDTHLDQNRHSSPLPGTMFSYRAFAYTRVIWPKVHSRIVWQNDPCRALTLSFAFDINTYGHQLTSARPLTKTRDRKAQRFLPQSAVCILLCNALGETTTTKAVPRDRRNTQPTRPKVALPFKPPKTQSRSEMFTRNIRLWTAEQVQRLP